MQNGQLNVDFYVSIPMLREKAFSGEAPEHELKTDILEILKDRTLHELSGRPAGEGSANSISNRARRFGIGLFKLRVFRKGEPNDYQEYAVEIYVSVDIPTDMAVLTLYAIGVTAEISTLSDCVTRSEVLISKDGVHFEDIYDYIAKEYGFVRKGNPKLFITIHEDPESINKGLIASVLFGEQYFSKESPYGEIVDKEIMEKLNEEYGIAQYSYAKAYVHKNVLMQISPGFPSETGELLYLECMSLFYIEMLLFEEAAIVINNDKILNFLLNEKKSTIGRRLNQIYEINAEYAKTLAYREMMLSYPTSSSSMKHIRTAFGIEELYERLAKNKSVLQNIFDAQRDIANTRESSILNILALIITLMTIGSFFTDENFSLPGLVAISAILVLYLVVKRQCFARVGKRDR